MKKLLLAASFIAAGGVAQAATVSVNANANGGFGLLVSNAANMTFGAQLSAGDVVEISATGQIGVGGNNFTGPNGIDIDSSSGLVGFAEYTPLEEADRDAGGAEDSLMEALGALMGAFVAQSVVDAAGFFASDTDIGGGIASSDLFLIGDALTFTAAVDGTLFLGVNEGFAANNTGAYSVSIDPVPLPGGLPLLAGGLGLMGWMRRRARA